MNHGCDVVPEMARTKKQASKGEAQKPVRLFASWVQGREEGMRMAKNRFLDH